MIAIIACALSAFVGFIVGIEFFASCKNELDLERLKHRMTMNELVKIQKQISQSPRHECRGLQKPD